MNNRIGLDGRQVFRSFSQEDVRLAVQPFFTTRKEYLKKYAYNWRTRLLMEYERRKTYFLTLTFDDKHLPIGTPEQQLEWATDCLQKFFKRLRSKVEYHDIGLNFKYYAVTENGEELGRLHFHVLLFCDGTNKPILNHRTAVPLFRLIDETWQQGRTQIRVADRKKIYYVTKYIFKRCFDVLYHSWKSNGLGLSYMTEKLINFLRIHVQSFIHLGGQVRFLPRFIRDKVFDDVIKEKVNSDYLSSLIPASTFDKRYYVVDWQRQYSPIPDWVGDRLCKMFTDSDELRNLIKYGGYLK